MKVLGVVLDRHLTLFPWLQNYHAQAIRHIRHLLSTELAQTLACSLILSRINYCNITSRCTDRHYSETAASSEQCSPDARRGDPTPSHYCTSCIGCQSSGGSLFYKLAVLTYKVRSTSTVVYVHRRIAKCARSRTFRSSAIPLLDQPFMRTDFSRRALLSSAPSVWNSLQ